MLDDSNETHGSRRVTFDCLDHNRYTPELDRKNMQVTITVRKMNVGELQSMFANKYVNYIPNNPDKYVKEKIKNYLDLLPEDHERTGGFWLVRDNSLKYHASVYGDKPEHTVLGYFQPIDGALKDHRPSDHRSIIFAQCEQMCIVLNNSTNVIQSDTSIPELNIVAGEWLVLHYDKMLDRLTRELTSIGFEPKFV